MSENIGLTDAND